MLIPLALNILWVPVVTLLTKGKYGDTNAWQFLILSLCIPLQVFINLLWSLSFGAKKYKSVTTITICSAIANIILNLVLISQFKGFGAAVAFFATTVLQCGLYYRLVYTQVMRISLFPTVIFMVVAVVIYFITINLHLHYIIQLAVAAVGYFLIVWASKQLTKQHIYDVKNLLSS